METAIDTAQFRTIMGRFATGVTVITFDKEGQAAGMTANAFLSVSLNPALVLVSVRREARFTQCVAVGGTYGVNFLGEDQEHLSRHFGGRPQAGLEEPFFQHLGTPLLSGSLAQLVATVMDVHPAGDHLLYIGEVNYVWCGPETRPLIFYSGEYKQIHAREPSLSWYTGEW